MTFIYPVAGTNIDQVAKAMVEVCKVTLDCGAAFNGIVLRATHRSTAEEIVADFCKQFNDRARGRRTSATL